MADDPGGLRPNQTQPDQTRHPDQAQLAGSGTQTAFVTPGAETPRGNDHAQTAADAVLTGAAQQLQISGGTGRSGRSTQSRAAPAAADAQDQEMLDDEELPDIPDEFLGADDQIADLAAHATEAQITAAFAAADQLGGAPSTYLAEMVGREPGPSRFGQIPSNVRRGSLHRFIRDRTDLTFANSDTGIRLGVNPAEYAQIRSEERRAADISNAEILARQAADRAAAAVYAAEMRRHVRPLAQTPPVSNGAGPSVLPAARPQTWWGARAAAAQQTDALPQPGAPSPAVDREAMEEDAPEEGELGGQPAAAAQTPMAPTRLGQILNNLTGAGFPLRQHTEGRPRSGGSAGSAKRCYEYIYKVYGGDNITGSPITTVVSEAWRTRGRGFESWMW
jgi:hypothetical protein